MSAKNDHLSSPRTEDIGETSTHQRGHDADQTYYQQQHRKCAIRAKNVSRDWAQVRVEHQPARAAQEDGCHHAQHARVPQRRSRSDSVPVEAPSNRGIHAVTPNAAIAATMAMNTNVDRHDHMAAIHVPAGTPVNNATVKPAVTTDK